MVEPTEHCRTSESLESSSLLLGDDLPLIHAFTFCRETPSRSAKSDWLMLRALSLSMMRSFMVSSPHAECKHRAYSTTI